MQYKIYHLELKFLYFHDNILIVVFYTLKLPFNTINTIFPLHVFVSSYEFSLIICQLEREIWIIEFRKIL